MVGADRDIGPGDRFARGDTWTIFHTSNFFVDIQSIRIPRTIVIYYIVTREENGILIYNNHTIFICEANIYNQSNDWDQVDVKYDNLNGVFDWTEVFFGSQTENDYITVIDRFNSDNPKEDILVMIERVSYWTAFDVEVRILRKYDGENKYFWEYMIANELIYQPGKRSDIQVSDRVQFRINLTCRLSDELRYLIYILSLYSHKYQSTL